MPKPWIGVLALCLLAAALPVAAAPDSLILLPGDVRIEQRSDGGYHLFIRARPGLGSVLLTESTKDPGMREPSYTLRSLEKNPVNGDEKRLLGGSFLAEVSGGHSLIDSSSEPDPVLGAAYHIFIPWVVAWGYPGSRNGRVFIADGSFINIRTFERKYADYSGAFSDNPYVVRVSQSARPAAMQSEPAAPAPPPGPATAIAPATSGPVPGPAPAAPAPAAAPAAAPAPSPVPAAPAAAKAPAGANSAQPPARSPRPGPPQKRPDLARYMPETLRAFGAIAAAGGGELRYAENEHDITVQLSAILGKAAGMATDIVLCIDATETMQNDIVALAKTAPAMFRSAKGNYPSLRIGLVVYRDYFEEFLTRRHDFTSDIAVLADELASIRVAGGRDIPEAVYEALYSALREFPWSAEKRLLVLIGDAPPHPLPRGKIDRALVEAGAAELGVEMDAIALPE